MKWASLHFGGRVGKFGTCFRELKELGSWVEISFVSTFLMELGIIYISSLEAVGSSYLGLLREMMAVVRESGDG